MAKKKVAAPKKVESKPGPVVKTVKAVVENVLGDKGKARRTKRRAAVKKVAAKVKAKLTPAPKAAAPAKPAAAMKPAKKAAKK